MADDFDFKTAGEPKRAKVVAVEPSSIPSVAKSREPWPRVPVIVAVVAGVVGSTLGFTAGFGGGFAVGHVTKPTATKKKADKTYTRDIFDTLVMGKTPDEIIMAVGKPDYTNDTGMWTYLLATYDPASKQMDSAAEVHFNNADNPKCRQVRFR